MIQEATYQLIHRKNLYQDISSIHLIYAGDRGQGAFRSALKLLFMKGDAEDSECVSECIANIGHMYCGKDNYQVLKHTYIPKHNTMMEEIYQPEDRLFLPGDKVNA